MKRNYLLFLLLPLFSVVTILAQEKTPFRKESAASFLKVISQDIGPRPMGSPNEKRAMQFALQKFREFGLNDAFILPLTRTPSTIFIPGTNTQSGTAIGVLKGKSDRIIVIGAHIDSSSPEVDGANDDGSGSAVVLELARVLAQRACTPESVSARRHENESTIVFALFGGEEQGLQGSRHFVSNFPHIDRVALMLQIDMANGTDWILPLIHAGEKGSPEWLVRATYEEFKNLGYKGLSYPTHFFTLTSAIPGGGIGSDHIPFLERGIPAIDLTTDINDPIHTPQDTFENFKTDGLQRSGDLIFKLIERFDGGVPENSFSRYLLLQVGDMLFFIPLWSLWFFVFLSLALSIFVLLQMRKVRTLEEERKVIPGLKLFFLLLVIQSIIWLSDDLVSIIKGVRYPWYQDLTGYFLLGFFALLLGGWIALRFSPRLHLSRDPYRYFLRGTVLFWIFIVLTLIGSVKMAFYFSFALFFLSIAMIFKHPLLKLGCLVIAPHFVFRLCFSEGFPLIVRSISETSLGILINLLGQVFTILLFSLISFPFLSAIWAIRLSMKDVVLPLKVLRRNAVGLTIAILFLTCAFVLIFLPSYSSEWQQRIHIYQNVDQNKRAGNLKVYSSDYLTGANITWGGQDTLILDRRDNIILGSFEVPEDDWIIVDRTMDIHGDSSLTYNILLTLRFKHNPYKIEVAYKSNNRSLENGSSSYAFSIAKGEMKMRWYSFPDTVLVIPIVFTSSAEDVVIEDIRATFIEQMVPVSIRKPYSVPISRTEIQKKINLSKTANFFNY